MRVGRERLEGGGVGGVVVEAACVLEELADADRVAVADETRQPSFDRVVEREAVLLGELENERGGGTSW